MEFLFYFFSDILAPSDELKEVQPIGYQSLEVGATDELALNEEEHEEHNIFSLCEFH